MWTTITLALDGAGSLAAAFTPTASIVRTIRHTLGRIRAPTERQAALKIADARLSPPWRAHLEKLAKHNAGSPG